MPRDTLIVLYTVGLLLNLLSPRGYRLRYHGELAQQRRGVGWRGRRKVDRALRLGGQVSDPRLASLAAAQAQRQMELLDYRGPLLPSEKAMFVPAVLAIVLFVTLGRGPGDCVLIALVVSVGYLTGDVGLRRLIPTHRRPENRLRRAYEDNLKLAEKAYAG